MTLLHWDQFLAIWALFGVSTMALDWWFDAFIGGNDWLSSDGFTAVLVFLACLLAATCMGPIGTISRIAYGILNWKKSYAEQRLNRDRK